MKRINSTSGFTLIEALVVITLSVVLLGLIFGPIISSFNLTHQAQMMTEAQDTARQTMEVIHRELSQAMFVYGNSNSPINFYLKPGVPIPVKYAKLDFVLPKLLMHCNNPTHEGDTGGEPRDYERGNKAWPECPYCQSEDVEARPIQPLRQEPTIVRYFIGLRENDPSIPYANIYNMDTVETDNPYVLYRAEFRLQDDTLFPADMTPVERLNWANFFYSDEDGGGSPIWQNWRKVAKVVGHSQDIDLITIQANDPNTPDDDIPIPSVKFMPYSKDNDTLTATYTADKGVEAPSACPTIYRASHGHWGPGFQVMVYSSDYGTYYYTDVNNAGNLCIYDQQGNQVFDISAYQQIGQIDLTSDLKMMFNVDPDKGEVTFNFPATWSVYAEDIQDMYEKDFVHNRDMEGVAMAERKIVIGEPIGLVPEAKIIPGSEQVVGPDMTPGGSYGRRYVRYDRVPLALGDPGLNQYKINYETGEVWFTSDPMTPLPSDPDNAAGKLTPITINYSFHTNRPGDIVKADYDTKNLINVALAIRLYDSTSGKPVAVELNDQVQVRNIAR